ncbi:MAG: U32 family peptidase [Syntrophomonadaceae bacterium]|nr:U32 family peptidase [Syntrophomonadaceae bacterium]
MELLAPAGNWEAFLAAMGNGADAVYLGGKSYSARQSAENFDERQIAAVLQYAHLREKKVYITVNTLIDQQEFNSVLDYIWKLYQMGVDAIIVQDLGLMAAVRHILPDLRVHASTQMTVHNSDGARFLAGQGINRVVLAREMACDEIATVCREVPEMEFEVFGHGALCYSYSGQCLFSSLLGGRSGNRGNCAQPCRLPYTLKSSHNKLPNIERRAYLLSPADLCLIGELERLQAIGIKSLKIEGRMKRPEYVAVVTRAYREALDDLAAAPKKKIGTENQDQLLKIFNRTFTQGHFTGDKTTFMSMERPDNRGVEIGQVLGQNREYMTSINLKDEISLGDGLEFRGSRGQGTALQVKELEVGGREAVRAGAGDVINLKLGGKTAAGDRVFKTHDVELIKAAQESIEAAREQRIPVDAEVYLCEGAPLKIVFVDEKGNRAEALSHSPAQAAEKHPLNHEVLRDKVDKLGNTPFCLRNFMVSGGTGLLVPFSDINDTRRRALAELLQLRLQAYQKTNMKQNDYLARRQQNLAMASSKSAGIGPDTILSIAVTGIGGANAAIEAGAGRVYLHLDGIVVKQLPRIDKIKQLIERGRLSGCEVVLALPRIQKPQDRDYRDYLDCRPESLMAGNLGSLHNCLERGLKVRGDYSLNVFNQAALDLLLTQGVTGVCLSPELNFKQLQSFNNLDKVEMLVYGEILLVTSEFCMLREVLGDGSVKCPAYCQQGSYYIQDQKGYQFPIATDEACRFYLFNSRTLCLIEELERILSLQPESIRIEALREDEEQVGKLVTIYQEAMIDIKDGGKVDLAFFKQKLAGARLSPFTRGHFNRGVL